MENALIIISGISTILFIFKNERKLNQLASESMHLVKVREHLLITRPEEFKNHDSVQ